MEKIVHLKNKMKESAKKYIWLEFKRKEVINWNDANKIEDKFFAEHKDILKPLIIKEFCPFCEKELEECSCGAKAVYWCGGKHCPMCESDYYYTNDKEILDEIAETETQWKIQ